MKIIVKKNSHRFCGIEVASATTIKQLKERLMEVTGLPIYHQRLIFSGRWLENERSSLQDCDIKENSLVYLSILQGTSHLKRSNNFESEVDTKENSIY